jgi:hypothetical protein
VNVIRLVIAFDLIEIFAARIALRRDANFQQMPQVFDRVGFVFSRIFDPRSFFDLNHPASNPFLHYWTITDSACTIYMMSEFPKRSLNAALNVGKCFLGPNVRRIAGVQTVACPPAMRVPPAFIRRCGAMEENSKFLIVFIRIPTASTVCELGRTNLNRVKDGLSLV